MTTTSPIELILERAHLSMQELGRIAMVDRATVWRWAKGHSEPRYAQWHLMAEHFNVSISDLKNIQHNPGIKLSGNCNAANDKPTAASSILAESARAVLTPGQATDLISMLGGINQDALCKKMLLALADFIQAQSDYAELSKAEPESGAANIQTFATLPDQLTILPHSEAKELHKLVASVFNDYCSIQQLDGEKQEQWSLNSMRDFSSKYMNMIQSGQLIYLPKID